jgi:hypothetical protein
MPVGHDLYEPTLADEIGLNERRKFANAAARQQRGRKADEVIHCKVRLKCQRFLILSVLMNESPAAIRLPMGK